MKYTYIDFMTKKKRSIRRTFLNWQHGGPLGVWGAVFASKGGTVFIPVYLLTPETLKALPPVPSQEDGK